MFKSHSPRENKRERKVLQEVNKVSNLHMGGRQGAWGGTFIQWSSVAKDCTESAVLRRREIQAETGTSWKQYSFPGNNLKNKEWANEFKNNKKRVGIRERKNSRENNEVDQNQNKLGIINFSKSSFSIFSLLLNKLCLLTSLQEN